MVVPRVYFLYSWVYDDEHRKFYNNYIKQYPSKKKTENYIKEIEKIWRGMENKIFKDISRIAGLKWKWKNIVCYVVGYGSPISDPLTLPIYQNDGKLFIETLTHELIHQLLLQNSGLEKYDRTWNHIYKKESDNVKIEVVVFAIQSHIYLKFFGEKRLKKDIQMCKNWKLKDHIRAWEIVQRDGYENIVNEFRNAMN